MKYLYTICLILMLTGCGSIVNNDDYEKLSVLETNSDISSEPNSIADHVDISDFKFIVLLQLGQIISFSENGLYTMIENRQIMLDYYQQLERNNWRILRPKTAKSPLSVYFNGEDGLFIKENSINDGARYEVSFDYYEGKKDSTYEQKYVDAIKMFLKNDPVYAISEYDTPDATQNMELRGFYAYTDKLEPAKIVIDKYDEITLINYDQYVVCDIDQDGEKEFITRLGYGSGRYIVTLSVWKYNLENKKLELAGRTQYEPLSKLDIFIRKRGDGVEIVSGNIENGEISFEEPYVF